MISGQSFITEYGHNSADQLTWMEYPDGEIVNYEYNDHMLLESVSSLAGTYASSILYDDAGRITHLTRGNNVLHTVYDYYDWNVQGGRLDTMTTTRTSDQIELQQLDYTYDNAGNITVIDDILSGETQTFDYDTLHRLTSAVVTDGLANYNESYDYNADTGNLQIKAGVTYTYDTTHKHAVASLTNGNSYGYDANGSMTTRHIASGPLAGDYLLFYDAENRLVEVKKNNVSIATFVYDGDGKQVKAIVNGVTTLFVGAHYEVRDSVVIKFYFSGTTRIAYRENGTLSYVLSDHLGSSSITTDANGFTTAEMLYKAWGETRLGSMDMDYQFTGQRNISDIGLYFYNARFYDASLGRFISADTIVPGGVQGLDRYAYTFNNPVNFTDPSGHFTCSSDPNNDDYCPNHFPSGGGNGGGDGDNNRGGDELDEIEKDIFKTIAKIEDPKIRAIAMAYALYYINAWKFEAWLNKNIPSAFGFSLAGSVSSSRGPVGGVLDISPSTYIFNWRSFELDRVMTAEIGGTGGFSGPISGSVYSNFFIVRGASTNEDWFGPYASVSVQAYASGGAITGVAIGLDKNNFPKPSQGSYEGGHVWTYFYGVGMGSTQVGGSAVVGTTFAHEGIFDLNLPFQIFPSNNPYLP